MDRDWEMDMRFESLWYTPEHLRNGVIRAVSITRVMKDLTGPGQALGVYGLVHFQFVFSVQLGALPAPCSGHCIFPTIIDI